MKKYIVLFSAVIIALSPLTASAFERDTTDYVILLHGLSRSASAMEPMAKHLEKLGYTPINIDYPSRHYNIQDLCDRFIAPEIALHCTEPKARIHFVTHSMGGILSRYYIQKYKPNNLGRVVMLGPPNHGSSVVDVVEKTGLGRLVLGPAFPQLSAKPDSFVNQMPTPDFELGIIAGNRSVNWINSMIIPGDDDGKVSVARSKHHIADDFLVVKRTHPFIMKAPEVKGAVARFLKLGTFEQPPPTLKSKVFRAEI